MVIKFENYFFALFVFIFSACSSSTSDIIEEDESVIVIEEPAPDPIPDPETTPDPEAETLALAESDFYTPKTNCTNSKNLVTDYSVDNDFSTDDSTILQSAIDEISASGCGELIIPAGNYSFADINLKSNVHIIVDEAAVIRPTDRVTQKNYAIFNFGIEGPTVENVSITSSSTGRFKIDLTQTNNINVTVFRLNNVDNFLLASFEVDDKLTKFSAVASGYSEYNDEYYWPHNGVIKDANINNADYGYGMVQTQAATNILFKNLDGSGGVTLRFETGYKVMNDLQIGGLHDMFAEDISCTSGNAALMVSPHSMHNGKVYVNGVTAFGCGFAVRIGDGYVSSSQTNPNLTPGTYEEVIVKNVTVTYASELAQLKSKHYKFMPCNLRELISTEAPDGAADSKWRHGPSIAGVLNDDPNYSVIFPESEVTANNFTEGYEYVTGEDAIEDADCN